MIEPVEHYKVNCPQSVGEDDYPNEIKLLITQYNYTIQLTIE